MGFGTFTPGNLIAKALKIGLAPKGNNRVPSIIFQVRTVSFREGMLDNIGLAIMPYMTLPQT